MNVVFTGVSTSQTLLLAITALSLLLLAVLLWANLRTSSGLAARPMVVLARTGVVYPANLVSWPVQTNLVKAPARAPPTLNSSSIHHRAKGLDPTGGDDSTRHIKTAD